MNIYEKLTEVQNALKAPKSKYNSFGGYHYRSLEDICEAVKPLLKEFKCALMLQDSIIKIEDRFYLQATASFMDLEANGVDALIEVQALAREEDSKKGMDGSQVTGTASSYARKYALNGLFLIDDTKDADTDEYQRQTQAGASKGKALLDERAIGRAVVKASEVTDEEKKKLMADCKAKNIDINEVLAQVGCKGKMTKQQYELAKQIVEETK